MNACHNKICPNCNMKKLVLREGTNHINARLKRMIKKDLIKRNFYFVQFYMCSNCLHNYSTNEIERFHIKKGGDNI